MRSGWSVLLPLLIAAAPVAASSQARLTVQAYDIGHEPVTARVVVDGREVGEAWSPILLAAGSHLVVVSFGDCRRAERVLLPADAATTLAVDLGNPLPMVLVEPGTFAMGSPVDEPGRHGDERRHQVALTRGFWIGATEVSQALYAEVVGTNPSRWVAPGHPVESVTWFDCVHFCNLLSLQHGFRPVYGITGDSVDWDPAADGYRLPTEAEWEYACRAGTGGVYGFGDDPGRLHLFGNYCDRSCECAWRDTTAQDGYFHTAPVGSFLPNAWGLHDMHGNVWEWCWDWWAPYADAALVDPQGPSGGSHKAERGGCWETGPGMCRAAYRHNVEPDQKRSYLGFRIVRTRP